MEAVRFFLVALAGLVLDVSVSWSVAHFLGLALWIAAAVGFCVAAGANYVAHELWTFQGGARQLSGGRAVRYGASLAAALTVRLAAVEILQRLMDQSLLVLIGAAGVSFCVNYLISKFLVFDATPA